MARHDDCLRDSVDVHGPQPLVEFAPGIDLALHRCSWPEQRVASSRRNVVVMGVDNPQAILAGRVDMAVRSVTPFHARPRKL